MKCGALETIWGIEISDLISLKWTFITPRGEKKNHAPKPTAKLWICELSHWWDSLVCALWQIFVGWVKPYTAYPARAAFWMAAIFPDLTMKYHVFIGRESIEKDVGNASFIPTYIDFKSRHGVRNPRSNLRYRNFRPDFPEMSIHNTPGKTRSCTKTHFHTLNICIISLMRLLDMCPMTSFRRLG